MAELEYAMLKNSIVTNIIVLDDPSQDTINYFKELHDADTIIPADETCFIGSEYEGGVFWNNKPYQSWIKDYEIKSWKAPVERPQDDNIYSWNEEEVSWKIENQADLDKMENQ
jgi:hypothetical protein